MSTLSIIIPVFNVEKYLRQCLDSVLVDNGFRGQVLCVNDGSTDGSAAILDKYAKKYPNIEIITQRNAGLSVARNVGFDRATGEYVLFLDSDDWVLPNSLEKLRKHINNEDTIYFNTITYEDETSTYGDRTDIKEYAHISGSESFAITSYTYRSVPFVTVCGKLYKRSFLKENHLYNEPDIYHEDNLLTNRRTRVGNSFCMYLYATYGDINDSFATRLCQEVSDNCKKDFESEYVQIPNNEICALYASLIVSIYSSTKYK